MALVSTHCAAKTMTVLLWDVVSQWKMAEIGRLNLLCGFTAPGNSFCFCGSIPVRNGSDV